MADSVPAGSDVSSGTSTCTQCGYRLQVGSTKHLPPCPSCGNGHYETLSGGDSKDGPLPRPALAGGAGRDLWAVNDRRILTR